MIKYGEAVAILCCGMSFRALLIVPICVTFVFGVLITVTLNPIGVYGLKKYENLTNKLTKKKSDNNLEISDSGLLISELYGNDRRVIHIGSIYEDSELRNVIILFFDRDGNYIKRIDAEQGRYGTDYIELYKVFTLTDRIVSKKEKVKIDIGISIDHLIKSSTDPELISFWDLPNAIASLEKIGISAFRHSLYYYRQLLKPLIMSVVALASCCFASFNSRSGSEVSTFFKGIISGFASYGIIEILALVFINHSLPPLWSILLPTSLVLLSCNFIILHLHEA
jgi:lipopolysaccharide export LptBFGC system permease protein LptF